MLLDVTTTLGKKRAGISWEETWRKNHVEQANLLSRRNIKMGHWMENQNKPNITSYLSSSSQNKLTVIVGRELVKKKIVAEVNEADFFGKFVDKTTAVSHGRVFSCWFPVHW